MDSHIRAMGAEADAIVGNAVPPEACKAWVGQMLAQRPDLKGSLKRFMQSNGIGRGAPVRKRFDFKYSRVGIAWDGAGVLQQNDPTALYTVQIGGVDPVLGQMTQTDTNVVNAGKQDSAELFKAYAMGFTLQLVNQDLVTIDSLASVYRALLENVSSVLTLGTQNKQRFPTLSALPGIAAGFQTAGGAPPTVVTAAATQGKQSLVRFDPPVYLGAGESYSVELVLKRSTTTGITLIPQGVSFANLKVAVQCVMYGVSYTGIPG